jgi:hypothetical protein
LHPGLVELALQAGIARGRFVSASIPNIFFVPRNAIAAKQFTQFILEGMPLMMCSLLFNVLIQFEDADLMPRRASDTQVERGSTNRACR